MLVLPDHLWPLFYTGRAKATATVGVHLHNLGPAEAVNQAQAEYTTEVGLREMQEAGDDIVMQTRPKMRREAIHISRVAITMVHFLLPEDAAHCGMLGHGELVKELRLQKHDLTDNDPVTLVFFSRRMEDRA